MASGIGVALAQEESASTPTAPTVGQPHEVCRRVKVQNLSAGTPQMGSSEAGTTAAGSGYAAGRSSTLATTGGAATRSYGGTTSQENYGASTGSHYEERCYTQQQ